MNKKYFFLIAVILIAVSIGLIMTQSYPVLLVNGQSVYMKYFTKDYSIAVYYYQKLMATYNQGENVDFNSSDIKDKINLAVLNQLVENKLIEQELEKMIKEKDIESMVNSRIEDALKQKDLTNEVNALYGINLDEFKEMILKPQAEKEIMAGRLSLENSSSTAGLDEWLKQIKQRAKVVILLPNFKWDGTEVVSK